MICDGSMLCSLCCYDGELMQYVKSWIRIHNMRTCHFLPFVSCIQLFSSSSTTFTWYYMRCVSENKKLIKNCLQRYAWERQLKLKKEGKHRHHHHSSRIDKRTYLVQKNYGYWILHFLFSHKEERFNVREIKIFSSLILNNNELMARFKHSTNNSEDR
jgi:hypothetical protein